MPLTLVTPPQSEPISVAEVRHQIRQGDSIDDGYIGSVLIPAVRERFEKATGRAAITQTWDYVLDGFPSCDFIDIPKPPLQSVTYVRYIDTGGTTQTMTVTTDYLVQAPSGPRAARGRVYLPFSESWPTPLSQIGAVTIRFICGYGSTTDSVPALVRQAMLVDAAHLYAHREDFATEPSGWVHRVYFDHRDHPVQRVAA